MMSGLKPLLDPITTSSTDSSNSTRRDNSRKEVYKQTKKKFLYILSVTMVILITTFTLLFSRIISLTTASSPSLEVPQHQQGVITQLCLNHTLQYNEEARKASKKLYELLYDYDNAFYDDENMLLGSTKMYPNTYSKQPYVANGYIGSRIPNIGFGYALDTVNLLTNSGAEIPGALDNGWPLRNHRFAGAFVSDFYCLEEKLNSTNFPELDDNGYSTVISTIPQWTNLQFSLSNDSIWFNPQEVSLDDVTNYSQNMSMRNGVVTTQMDWLDGMINVKSEVMTHKKLYSLGMMSLTISLNLDNLPSDVPSIDLNLYDILDFNTSHRAVLQDLGFDDSNEGIFMIVEPKNVPYSNAAVYSTCTIEGPPNSNFDNFTFSEDLTTGDRIAQMSSVVLSRDFPSVTIRKYVGIMSTEFNSNAQLDLSNIELAKSIATGSKGNFDSLMSSNAKAWAYIYNDAFIEIPSDALLEMTARSSLYHLLANTRTFNVSAERGLPVGVSGLSSDSYGGMVFWDSDIWMQPALLPFFPDIAKNMNNYRNATHNQARLNAQQYGYPGAVYPWTSGRYANCTSTGPCIDYEYHINVDVALASFSIYMNGADGIDDDYLRYTTWPIVRDAAEFFTAYVKYNATMDKYETYNLTDPDEFANHVNNGAFTNAGIKTLLKWATDIGNHLEDFVDPKWMDISKKIYIPRSPSNITLEYSGMNSSVEIKQADVALMVYPLGYITDESILNNAIKDLYYYSERQSASGPAMTYPVFVAAAAGMLNHGSSSQSYLYKSVLPYLRGPFAQFSEQSDDNFLTNGLTQPAFPFLTANGGFLQSILFGLTGLRYSYEVDPNTKKIFRLLKFSPVVLPLLPGGIAIRNFKYMNQVLDIIIDDYNGTIVHKSGNASIRIKVPDRSLIRDRDISVYNGTNGTDYPQFSNDYSEEGSGDRPVSAYGTYYTVNPGEELVLPLFRPELNVEGNIVESKQITNLTVGVSGDVAFSALDGNNYTHWQPAYKYSPAKLLIDLGEDNLHEIKSGLILWGERPAKNISISILPHTYAIEQFLANLTDVLEYSEVVTAEESISEALEDAGVDTSFVESGACDEDITAILNWKTENFEGILTQIEQSTLLNKHFVRILDNYPIHPTEPYFREVYNKSMIEILPSNKTEFSIDYSLIDSNSTSCSFIPDMKNTTEWRKTRFILLSIEGSYDDDIDIKGGTIKEIVLKS